MKSATPIVCGAPGSNNWEFPIKIQIRWTGAASPTSYSTTADITETPGEAPPANWQLLQFKPGDECAVYLGRYLAIAGVITSRQTAYDKQNKGVELQGIGVTWYAARASIIHATSNFDNKTFEQATGAQNDRGPTGCGKMVISPAL